MGRDKMNEKLLIAVLNELPHEQYNPVFIEAKLERIGSLLESYKPKWFDVEEFHCDKWTDPIPEPRRVMILYGFDSIEHCPDKQETLVHHIDAWIERGVQIIILSSKAYYEIDMDGRLRSRVGRGLALTNESGMI